MRVAVVALCMSPLLASCGGPHEAAVVTPGWPVAAKTATPVRPNPSTIAADLDWDGGLGPVDDLLIPTERSCLLRAPKLDHAVLHLRADGPAFARLESATDARVHVPADPVGTGLLLELKTGQVALTGIVPAADLAVYATRPLTLGGLFLPRGDSALRIAGASTDHVVLEARFTPFALSEVTTRLRNDVACDATSLQPTPSDPRASLGRAIGRGQLVGDAVPLALTAHGEPVARLAHGLAAVEILEQTDGAARIVWRVHGGYVSGWVPSTQLRPNPGPEDIRSGRFARNNRHGKSASRFQRACDWDVPLGVHVGEDARLVGRIRAGAVMQVYGGIMGSKDWVEVLVPAAKIELLNAASLFVRRSDIMDCAEIPTAAEPRP